MFSEDNLISDEEYEGNEIINDEWNEKDVSILCLFCPKTLESSEEIYLHCFNCHQFDIYEFKKIHNLDCYSYIKFINYVRSKSVQCSELLNILPGNEPWNENLYLNSHIPNDLILCFDIEYNNSNLLSMLEPITSDRQVLSEDALKPNFCQISEDLNRKLLNRLKNAENMNLEYQQKLNNANMDINKMKQILNRIFDENGDKLTINIKEINNKEFHNVEKVYFDSYAHFGIHEEMIKDKIRTETYMNCILSNSDLFKDAIVLDVGCGTGILSLFAAKAGAKLVISVDMSDIVYNAMDIVIRNGFEGKIEVLKGRVEDITLPIEKVDIIISEWMGYCLLYESMLDSVLYARDKYLTQNGVLMPSHTSLHLVAISDINENQANFWKNVYGFDMSCMIPEVCEEAIVQCVDKNKIVTNIICLETFDLTKCLVSELQFAVDFELKPVLNTKITALVLFFDVHFQCKIPFSFSTSPECEPTHWKQTVLNLLDPIDALKDKAICGKIGIRKDTRDHRALKISVTLEDKIQQFHM